MEHTNQTYHNLSTRNPSATNHNTLRDDVALVEPLTTEVGTCDIINRFVEHYYCPLIIIIISITVIVLIIVNLRNL